MTTPTTFAPRTAQALLELLDQQSPPAGGAISGSTEPVDRQFRPRNVFRNDSSEVVPRFGLMRITGVVDEDGRYVVTVDKPNSDATALYVINGPREVASGDRGAYQDAGKQVVLRTTESAGEVGPGNSWDAVAAGSGYRIRGQIESGIVLATLAAPQQVLRGTIQTTAAIGAATLTVTPTSRFDGVSGPVTVKNADAGTERAAGTTVYAIRGTTSVDESGTPVQWVELPAGGASQEAWRFEPKGDLNYGETSVVGWLLNSDGTRHNDGATPTPALIETTVYSDGNNWLRGANTDTGTNPAESSISKRGDIACVRLVTSPTTDLRRLEIADPSGSAPIHVVAASAGETTITKTIATGRDHERPQAPSLSYDVDMDAATAVDLNRLVMRQRGASGAVQWLKFTQDEYVVLAIATVTKGSVVGTEDGEEIVPTITADAGVLMTWDAANDKYVSQKSGSTSIKVDLGAAQLTDLTASRTEPIALVCRKEKQSDGSDAYIVKHPLDLRQIPGFVLGSDAAADAQGIHHPGGSQEYEQGREDC